MPEGRITRVVPVTIEDRTFEELKLPRPIALSPLTIQELSPANQVLCAAAAGYSHVGLRLVPAFPTEARWGMVGDTPMVREVETNLRLTGMKVLDVEALRVKPDTRAVNWEPFFETAERLGATEVRVVGNDPDLSRFADNFAELCELAFPHGLALSIEPMPWNDLSTVKQTGEVLEHVNHVNAGLLVDPIHFFRAKNTFADIDALPPGALRYCQMCDMTVPPKNMDEVIFQARNYRLSPGAGTADLKGLLAHLKDIPISVQCINNRLVLSMSPLDRSRMYLEDTVALLNSIGEV
ncbi:sugar phosphate isomerase/epimerase [Sutterella sp.]|uniref:sugar phosphate isomerase/epimerase family protein n=1 Tax=Sutterella sp. TaxID=1981025 RepID=UPI0026E0BEB0|nr:sugar phosphate isomerase/epimerase [Sutterella sp.]MDO5532097.1 sugar phosphate isomerase/epimerase [Sutterella sp.]